MPGYQTPEGTKIVSVTEIVKCFNPNPEPLLIWAAGFGSKELFKAGRYEGANAGSLCHTWIDAATNKRPMPSIPPNTTQREHDQAHVSYRAWLDWYAKASPEIEHWETEIKMIHRTKQFGGTCDLLASMT